MDFLNLIRSAEELLFELTILMLLYPRTLWRCLWHPLQLAHKVNVELGQEGQRRFDDMVSPPLCLLISVALGSALSPNDDAGKGTNALGDWITQSFYNELIFGALLLSMLPLMYAWLLLRLQRRPFNRDNVRSPFYVQAYLVSPMALLLPLGGTLAYFIDTPWLRYTGMAIVVMTIAIYLVNATRVAMRLANCGVFQALWLTLRAILLALVASLLMIIALVDPTLLQLGRT